MTVWWIALAGLALGACGAVLGLISRARNRAIEERVARIEVASKGAREREARRARLHAFLEQEVDVKWYLTIRNQGQGSARDFTVSIDGFSLEQSPLVDPAQLDRAGLAAVGGRGTVRIPLKCATRPDHLQVELTWSDAGGELGLFEAELAGAVRQPEAIEQR